MARQSKKGPSPAYQWYPKDALSDGELSLMPLNTEGLFRRLCDHAWVGDGLPSDDDQLFGLVKSKCKTRAIFDALWKQIAHKFPLAKDGKRRNLRQERYRKEKKKFSKSRSLAAKKRWEKGDASAHARASASAIHVEQCSASASASAPASAPKSEVQKDQLHRRAARAGLGVDITSDERDIRRLTALCHADLIRPYYLLTKRLPNPDGLVSAVMQQASGRMPVSESMAQRAVERAMNRWQRRSA